MEAIEVSTHDNRPGAIPPLFLNSEMQLFGLEKHGGERRQR